MREEYELSSSARQEDRGGGGKAENGGHLWGCVPLVCECEGSGVALTACGVGSAAGFILGGDAADVFVEAVGLAVGEEEVEGVVGHFGSFEGEMGEARVVVFDFDGEGLGGEDGFSVFEDGG